MTAAEPHVEAGTTTEGPELFFALVSALGTDLQPVITALEEALQAVEYKVIQIRLSRLLWQIPDFQSIRRSPEDDRIQDHMEAGTQFRERLERGHALAAWGLVALRDERQKVTKDEKKPAQRRAY